MSKCTTHDLIDITFRVCFSLIFLGLGAEHVFHDDLIRTLMPDWVAFPRAVSLVCGLILMGGGSTILLGWRMRQGAIVLGVFLIVVTAAVHLPAIFMYPSHISPDAYWMWDILQRSNLIKNLCLFGVCVRLLDYSPGRFRLGADSTL